MEYLNLGSYGIFRSPFTSFGTGFRSVALAKQQGPKKLHWKSSVINSYLVLTVIICQLYSLFKYLIEKKWHLLFLYYSQMYTLLDCTPTHILWTAKNFNHENVQQCWTNS